LTFIEAQTSDEISSKNTENQKNPISFEIEYLDDRNAFTHRDTIEETKDQNNIESIKSSISESSIAEGSMIVQNLPCSKIVYATKKN
jgi:hypothetical protein